MDTEKITPKKGGVFNLIVNGPRCYSEADERVKFAKKLQEYEKNKRDNLNVEHIIQDDDDIDYIPNGGDVISWLIVDNNPSPNNKVFKVFDQIMRDRQYNNKLDDSNSNNYNKFYGGLFLLGAGLLYCFKYKK